MTMTATMNSTLFKMSELDLAMEKYIEQIVLEENRPIRAVELRQFDYEGKEYKMSIGTCRNKLSKFKKAGKIEVQFRSSEAYYSIPGHTFSKQVIPDHVGVISLIGRQTPLYRWLKNRPVTKQSLHDIRLIFYAKGIWKVYSYRYSHLIDSTNKDIKLSPIPFLNDIEVKITVHHSDTVSVAIACSYRPFVIDVPDILYLVEVLTRIETTISAFCIICDCESITVPRYTNWIAKLWHFGWDSLDRYDGEEFHITFEEGISDLWRIYTKKMKVGKKLRIEHQEMPNKPILEAVLKKLFLEDERLF